MGLVLGSGLGDFVDALDEVQSVGYADIPGFSSPSVAEHKGRLVCVRAAGVPVIVLQGRLHPYEGLPTARLLLPTAVLACLGVDVAVVTNAAGGLNRHYPPGDLMVIRDQVDLHFHDPLRRSAFRASPTRPARRANPNFASGCRGSRQSGAGSAVPVAVGVPAQGGPERPVVIAH